MRGRRPIHTTRRKGTSDGSNRHSDLPPRCRSGCGPKVANQTCGSLRVRSRRPAGVVGQLVGRRRDQKVQGGVHRVHLGKRPVARLEESDEEEVEGLDKLKLTPDALAVHKVALAPRPTDDAAAAACVAGERVVVLDAALVPFDGVLAVIDRIIGTQPWGSRQAERFGRPSQQPNLVDGRPVQVKPPGDDAVPVVRARHTLAPREMLRVCVCISSFPRFVSSDVRTRPSRQGLGTIPFLAEARPSPPPCDRVASHLFYALLACPASADRDPHSRR